MPLLSLEDEQQPQIIYSVSRLNREAKYLLNDYFPSIWVTGELSNLARPSSGHLYFTLKDSEAQIRCALFRMQRFNLGFTPVNGLQVLVKAKVSLYEARGDYQLIVEYLEEAGDGALRQAFEALKTRLAAEGLFDPAHKQSIPPLPKRIGAITSPTGAAIRDILTVLKRRFPAIPVILYPVSVQGAEAKKEIAQAIATADRRRECDVLILARGGGSLEDLWAFNEEIVARALFHCSIPVVTGIGHEIDFTIADFVADLRAPTPSAAAEAVSPDQAEWLAKLSRIESQLVNRLQSLLESHHKTMLWLDKRLQQVHPEKRLQDQAQRLDELELRLKRAARSQLNHLAARAKTQAALLQRHDPWQRIQAHRAHQQYLSQRLISAVRRSLEKGQHTLGEISHALNAVSPLATLSRGYAIIARDDGHILTSYQQTEPGERVEARLAQGRLICQVEETHED